MDKTIINYASGGLGNVLLPLSSCMALAKKTNRKMIICWEPTFACAGSFKDFFEDDIEVITKNDLLSLSGVKIFGNLHDIQYDSYLFGNNSLNSLSSKFSVLPVEFLKLDLEEQNVIIYHNNFLPTINKEESLEQFRNLKWKPEILNQIKDIEQELKIDKTVFGAHARATDFNDGIGVYADAISTVVRMNPDCRIFLCSDSKEWEEKLHKLYPANVFSRNKSSYVTKQNENAGWSNNIFRSVDSVVEGIIDMHLLSKTNFTIYNGHSSFAQMVNNLIK